MPVIIKASLGMFCTKKTLLMMTVVIMRRASTQARQKPFWLSHR
jgi:hypothetical protein